MKTCITVIKADIGSIGGHVAPSSRLVETVRRHVHERASRLISDFHISYTGDDIAILSVDEGFAWQRPVWSEVLLAAAL